MNIGQNFSPTQQNGGDNFQQPQGGGLAPIQQAIQILRIRFPHAFGAMQPSPLAGGGQAMTGPSPLPIPMLPGGQQPGQAAQPMPMAPMPSFGGPAQAQPPQGAQAPASPVIHYQPPPAPPGGTAGPNPPGVFPRPNRPFDDTVDRGRIPGQSLTSRIRR